MTNARIYHRYDSAAAWTAANPVLGFGELGIEAGTPDKFKIGDGVSTWSSLPYSTGAQGEPGDPLADGSYGDITVSGGLMQFVGKVSNADWDGADLEIANGGTGASSAAAARTNLGLGNVDNTADANKPLFTSSVRGLVPPPVTPAGNYLKDDGTWAAVAVGAGWTQLATASGAGSSAIDFTSIPQTYTELLIQIEGVQFSPSDNLAWSFQNSGGTWNMGQFFLDSTSNTIYGSIWLPQYQRNAGGTHWALAQISSNNDITGTQANQSYIHSSAAWRCNGGIRGVRLRSNNGNAFANGVGTVRLLAR